MNAYRLLLTCCLGMTVLTTAAFAQEPGAPPRGATPHSPQQGLRRLTRMLGLTASQQSAIEPILVDRQQRMTALRNEDSGDGENSREQMHAIRQDTDAQIEALLTDSQRQLYAQLRQHGIRHRPSRPPSGGDGASSSS